MSYDEMYYIVKTDAVKTLFSHRILFMLVILRSSKKLLEQTCNIPRAKMAIFHVQILTQRVVYVRIAPCYLYSLSLRKIYPRELDDGTK